MFEVYPNPSHGIFVIKSSVKDVIEVYSVEGKLIDKFAIQPGVNEVKLNKLNSGIYLLKSIHNNKGLKIAIE